MGTSNLYAAYDNILQGLYNSAVPLRTIFRRNGETITLATFQAQFSITPSPNSFTQYEQQADILEQDVNALTSSSIYGSIYDIISPWNQNQALTNDQLSQLQTALNQLYSFFIKLLKLIALGGNLANLQNLQITETDKSATSYGINITITQGTGLTYLINAILNLINAAAAAYDQFAQSSSQPSQLYNAENTLFNASNDIYNNLPSSYPDAQTTVYQNPSPDQLVAIINDIRQAAQAANQAAQYLPDPVQQNQQLNAIIADSLTFAADYLSAKVHGSQIVIAEEVIQPRSPIHDAIQASVLLSIPLILLKLVRV